MSPGMRRGTVTVLAAVVLLALASSASAQCAMCRTLLKTPEGQRLAEGLRSGILLLLAAPFAAFAGIAALAINGRRKSERMADPGRDSTNHEVIESRRLGLRRALPADSRKPG